MRYSGCMGSSLAKQPRQNLAAAAALMLVLLAGVVAVAGVAAAAIVPITANPAEVFGETIIRGTNCNRAEIYDPMLAAANLPGPNLGGAVQGSDIGCRPVCALMYPALSDPADRVASKAELADLSQHELTLNRSPQLARDSLVTLTKAEADMLVADAADPNKGLLGALAQLGEQVSGKSVLFRTPASVYLGLGAGIYVADFGEALSSVYLVERVGPAPNHRQCVARDATGSIVEAFGAEACDATTRPCQARNAASEISLRTIEEVVAAEERAAQRAAQRAADEEDGVAPQTLIAVLVLVALALTAVAVRGVMAARARKAKSERGTSEVSASAGSGGGGSPEGGNIPESPSSPPQEQ